MQTLSNFFSRLKFSKLEEEEDTSESKSFKIPLNPNPNPKKPDQKKIILNAIALISLFLILIMVVGLTRRFEQTQTTQQEFSNLISLIRGGEVATIKVSENKETIEAFLYTNPENPSREAVSKEALEFKNVAITNSSTLENITNALTEEERNNFRIGSGDGEVEYIETPKSVWTKIAESSLLVYLFLIIGLVAVSAFMLRRVSDSGNRAISFGDSKAKLYDELDQNKNKITFADVAGNEEAKQELNEVVDFLKRPEAYDKMGAKIPRGVLLVGSPGNGKTLMAKAIAGEAKVPFFYTSGSEFVEMFVGVGAGRVRSLFKRAKKKAPAVIFIDEIDALGRQRGAGVGNGNDEREQTLNQILVEMDGFESNSAVIIIGATNRPDVLDPALLRPGRFDRQITVTAPDRKEREQILKVHAKNKKFAKNVDFGIVAKRTPGFSGADLMNVLNEAAILAVRENKKFISNEILREAVEKVALGPQLKSKVITDEQKKKTAYHEAGHALTASVLPDAVKVQKVTIVPRGRAAGYTFHAEDDEADSITRTLSQFEAEITVLFGGYCSEQLVFGQVSTGASNDLAKATEIARRMVKKYGMSRLGPVSFDEDRGMTFLGKDMIEKQHYSEEVAKQIDLEIEYILQSGYKRCKEILSKYRSYLDKLSQALIEKETLELEEFNEIVGDILQYRKKSNFDKQQKSIISPVGSTAVVGV